MTRAGAGLRWPTWRAMGIRCRPASRAIPSSRQMMTLSSTFPRLRRSIGSGWNPVCSARQFPAAGGAGTAARGGAGRRRPHDAATWPYNAWPGRPGRAPVRDPGLPGLDRPGAAGPAAGGATQVRCRGAAVLLPRHGEVDAGLPGGRPGAGREGRHLGRRRRPCRDGWCHAAVGGPLPRHRPRRRADDLQPAARRPRRGASGPARAAPADRDRHGRPCPGGRGGNGGTGRHTGQNGDGLADAQPGRVGRLTARHGGNAS
jgi:hypothetical protein